MFVTQDMQNRKLKKNHKFELGEQATFFDKQVIVVSYLENMRVKVRVIQSYKYSEIGQVRVVFERQLRRIQNEDKYNMPQYSQMQKDYEQEYKYEYDEDYPQIEINKYPVDYYVDLPQQLKNTLDENQEELDEPEEPYEEEDIREKPTEPPVSVPDSEPSPEDTPELYKNFIKGEED